MQSRSSVRAVAWRSWAAVLCLLAVFVVSGVQIAHWDTQRLEKHASAQSALASDGLCPICYSVPVGHGAAPASILHVQIVGTPAIETVARQSEGSQPEFHLHIRPPPAHAWS
jgi:hypothetical protein